MQSWKLIVLAAAIFSEGLVQASHGCKSTKTITTTPTGIFACPLCILPTKTCKSNEPSLRPLPAVTSDCTVTVLDECPCTTCLPSATACSTTTTITKPASIQCDIACLEPTESVCKPGEPTGPPQYAVTTSRCTVISSKKGCPGCPSCELPTATACSITATITKPATFQCDIACLEPTESVCKPGESTGPPQYDVTTSRCTVISSKKSCPGCASCQLPTATACSTTATITKPASIQCEIACIKPTGSTCKPGESTGPAQYDVTTSRCTVTSSKKSCPGCASCVLPTPAPITKL